MTDEYSATADRLIGDEEDQLYGAVERDARRYNRAFTEEEEANGE